MFRRTLVALSLFIALSAFPALSQNCSQFANTGYSKYLGDCIDTATIQTPNPAPFTTSTPLNSTGTDASLSSLLISRVTDSTICSNNAVGTKSGGDEDVDSNVSETLLALHCDNGVGYVVGFNPTTLQVGQHNITQVANCPGPDGFSRNNDLLYYCRPGYNANTPLGKANGSTVYSITFSYSPTDTSCGKPAGQCPDPTSGVWAVFYDFATCPQAPTGPVTSGSTLGVGTSGNDVPLTQDLSWTGGQNTARYEFAYDPTSKGCYTLDTQGNGVSPVEYDPNGTSKVVTNQASGQPINAIWYIHDSSTNGKYVSVGDTTMSGYQCVGSDCPTSDGPFFWDWINNTMGSANELLESGHSSTSESLYINETNPGIYIRPLDNLSDYTKIGTFVDVTDSHFAGDVHNDTAPIVGATGGLAYSNDWIAPYRDEVFALDITGSGPTNTIWRFTHNFSSGSVTTCDFYCAWAIGFVGQQRDIFCWSSDMLGQLGASVVGGQTVNRSDMFCVKLAQN